LGQLLPPFDCGSFFFKSSRCQKEVGVFCRQETVHLCWGEYPRYLVFWYGIMRNTAGEVEWFRYGSACYSVEIVRFEVTVRHLAYLWNGVDTVVTESAKSAVDPVILIHVNFPRPLLNPTVSTAHSPRF
jgi:hypothetical protein